MNRHPGNSRNRARNSLLIGASVVTLLFLFSIPGNSPSDGPVDRPSSALDAPNRADDFPTVDQLNAIVRQNLTTQAQGEATEERLPTAQDDGAMAEESLLPFDVTLEGRASKATPKTRQIITRQYNDRPARFYAREVVVRVAPDVDRDGIARLLKDKKLRVVNYIAGIGVYRLVGPEGLDVLAAVEELIDSGMFAAVEPNFVAQIVAAPNDPGYGNQWSHSMVGSEQFWDRGISASNLVAAVIDTGVDGSHTEFSGRMVAGYNFVAGDTNADDDHGHGTHVSGIISAAGNNGIGVAGAVWDAKIMPIKVMDSSGSGSYFNIAQGITFAADNSATVINMSLAGGGASTTLQSAVTYAWNRNVMVFAATGNSGKEELMYPAACDHAIGVGATDSSDTIASYSTTGAHVDLTAPGSGIISTYPGGTYVTWSGTSMATPLAAGIGLMVQAAFPGIANDAAEQMIVDAAIDRGPAGRDNQHGQGRVDVTGIVAQIPGGSVSPPPTVSDLLATAPQITLQVMQSVGASSSSHQAVHSPDQTVDANTSTFWASAGGAQSRPEWVLLDMGYEREIDILGVRKSLDPALPLPKKLDVFAGDSLGQWTNLVSESDMTAPADDWRVWNVPTTVCRYVVFWMPQLRQDPIGIYRACFTEVGAAFTHDTSLTDAILSWSVPATAEVASYDLRCSTAPLTESNFYSAVQVASVPAASAQMTYQATTLPVGTTCYLAIKSLNDSGASPISNVVVYTTSGVADTIAPATISDLATIAGSEHIQFLPAVTALQATSSFSPAFGPASSVDANIYTAWGTSTSSSYKTDHIIYDLNQEHSVSMLRIFPFVSTHSFFPVDFEILTSRDMVSWDLAHAVNGYQIPNRYNWHDFSFGPVTARYVGIRILKGSVDPATGKIAAALSHVKVGVIDTDATNSVTLHFSAVGDDGMSGRAAHYEIVQSFQPIGQGTASEAILATGGLPSPSSPFSAQSITVTGLNPATTYHFGVRVFDEAGNSSGTAAVSHLTAN